MSKPSITWEGNNDTPEGVVEYVCGKCKAVVRLHSFSEANNLLKVLDAAYSEGAKEALYSMESVIESVLDITRSEFT